MPSRIRTAILPVAGRGTRLLPATKSVPKELLPVYDRPLIQLAVDEARAAGITRLVFVTHASKSAIQQYFERDPALREALETGGKRDLLRRMDLCDPTGEMELIFISQPEPRGLGHAILCGRDAVDPGEAFAVILPDDVILGGGPAIGEMARAYDRGMAAHMVATQTVPRDEVSRYGICRCERPAPGCRVPVSGLVEKPRPEDAPSTVAVIGRYVLDPGIFDLLAGTAAGAGGEIQLTDAIARAVDGPGVAAFNVTGRRFDCGNADGLLAASGAWRDMSMRRGGLAAE